MTTPTKPTKEATTPLPVLTEALTPERVRELAKCFRVPGVHWTDPSGRVFTSDEIKQVFDHWLRTQAEPLNYYLLRVALESVAFHIAMARGNIDNPFQHEREKALEYLRTLAPDPKPVPPPPQEPA